MAMDIDIVGGTSGNKAEVAGTNQLKVILETNATTNPNNIGGVRFYSENDQGLAAPGGTVIPFLQSPETDDDYRLRVSLDTTLDEEHLTTTAQNFTKHRMDATSFVPTWSANGYTTQATTPITTAAASSVLRTWKTFSYQGTETLAVDMELSFTFATGAALASPQVIEAGVGLLATSTPFDCFDGVYLRLAASGMYMIARNNSATDSYISNLFLNADSSAVNIWQPVSGRKYQFIIYVLDRTFEVWINDPVLNLVWQASSGNVPSGLGTPTASPSLNLFLRHYQATAPAVGAYATLSHYNVRRGGGQSVASSLADISSRTLESILSPGTLTTTGNQAITTGSITRPGAAAPTNTTSLLASLSGIVLETPSLAYGTDCIIMSYLNPALPTTTGTTFPQARRLRIDGVRIGSFVQTAITGGPFVRNYYIAYGSTALSLAGVASDTVTTKAYRRIQLELTQVYTATQAIDTLPAISGSPYMTFKNPIYVNPGEYVCLVGYNTGTVASAGTLQHAISFDYAWE